MAAEDASTENAPLRRAAATIRRLSAELAARARDEAVAVVGIGVRLPGGLADPESYWRALLAKRDLVALLPEHRREPFTAAWTGVHQVGGFLDDVLGFDPEVFGIPPREAPMLDPQQRLLLEVTWEALEDAAIPPRAAGLPELGFYVGLANLDYLSAWAPREPDFLWGVGSALCFAAGRIAHTLGFTGPAMTVDTACSSSLVATHLARRALVDGECDLAIAAGANLILAPYSTEIIGTSGLLAPDGRCRSFDARAAGFTRSEGCGAVVLKRLADAQRDGDRVYAVLSGSAINQDGRSASVTAPNVAAQIALLRKVLADARLEPADIGAVEAHGTGTALGDPIEMEAIVAALGRRPGALAVGSVKANLGHLESAAGVAGLIAAIQSVRHRAHAPLAHFTTLNPRISLAGSSVTLHTEPGPWPADTGRHGLVSSFGMSGTNAAVIVGPPPADEGTVPGPVAGFELSAGTDSALREMARGHADALARLPAEQYPAFAYTVTHGRARHDLRARVAAVQPAAAIAALRAIAADRPDDRVTIVTEPGTAPARTPVPRRAVLSLPGYPWQRRRYASVPAAGTTPVVP